jgi:hypothetical protein
MKKYFKSSSLVIIILFFSLTSIAYAALTFSNTGIVGDASFSTLTIPGIANSGNQCLHINSSGVVSGTGSDCGSGGGGSSQWTGTSNIYFAGNVGIGNTSPGELLSLGVAGTTKGVLSLSGNTSGKIIIQPQAAAGTYTLTLPNTAGTSNQYLQTDGSGNLTWATVASTAPPFASVTDASPIAWNVGTVPNGTITVNHTTGTRALNLTGLANGGYYTLVIKQDATGGAAMTLGTGCTWLVSGGGQGAITLSVNANAVDVLSFTYDGTYCYANFQNNFN